MTNIVEEHLESLVTKYQESNSRNAVRIGKALGRVNVILLEMKHNTDLAYDTKTHLIQDLKYIIENIDAVEL